MDGLWGWIVTVVGALVVLAVLRDVFHTLWHPSGSGWLSRHLVAAVWRVSRWRRRRARTGMLAGPTALVLVIVVWVAAITLGCSLVYWPHLSGGFLLGSELDPDSRAGWLDALYVSTVTLATLGFGDVVPSAGWLRIVVPMQALLGFGLLTASVTWVLQIYPALVRRRVLALRLAGLRAGPIDRLVGDPEGRLAAPLLDGLAADLVQIRVDLTQYSETYYFRDGEGDASLAATLGTVVDLQRAAGEAPREDVRVAGELLRLAVEDLTRVLDEQFLHLDAGLEDVLAAYAADHGHPGLRPG
ncbi:potassium channel family protein [Modestobacter sp. SYSU DS0875]